MGELQKKIKNKIQKTWSKVTINNKTTTKSFEVLEVKDVLEIVEEMTKEFPNRKNDKYFVKEGADIIPYFSEIKWLDDLQEWFRKWLMASPEKEKGDEK